MNLAKNCLKIVGLVFSISLIGCSDKKAEEADRAAQEQAQEHARANADANNLKAKEQQRQRETILRSNALKLSEVVGLYQSALGDLSAVGNQAVVGVDQMMRSKAYKEASEVSLARANEVVLETASGGYDTFRKVLRNYAEKFEDQRAQKKFAEVKEFVRTMANGLEKDSITAGITSCGNAEEWLSKYRSRHRSELGEQIKQMKECSEQLRPTLLELDAVQTSLDPWINDKQ